MRLVLVCALMFPTLIGVSAGASADLAQAYYHFTLARMYTQDKQFSDALAEFDKAIKLNPENVEAKNALKK